MDAETKRWFAHLDKKLDGAFAAQADFRERIVRLEEARTSHDREHQGHRKGIEQAGACVRRVDKKLTSITTISTRDKAKLAGFSAGIGAAFPVLAWLVGKALGIA